MINIMIGGEEFIFIDDELTSAENKAIAFLTEIEIAKRAF